MLKHRYVSENCCYYKYGIQEVKKQALLLAELLIKYMKKFLDSNWLRAVQFQANAVQ